MGLLKAMRENLNTKVFYYGNKIFPGSQGFGLGDFLTFNLIPKLMNIHEDGSSEVYEGGYFFFSPYEAWLVYKKAKSLETKLVKNQ